MSGEVPAWLAAVRISSAVQRDEEGFVSVLAALASRVPGPPQPAERASQQRWRGWNRAVLGVRLPRSCPTGAERSSALLVTPQSENLRGVIR